MTDRGRDQGVSGRTYHGPRMKAAYCPEGSRV